MRHQIWIATMIGLALLTTGCATPKGASGEEKRQNILQMRDQALAALYAKEPAAKAEIERSPGYAVFSDTGMALLILGGGHGYGVVVDNASKQNTYMQMRQVSVGAGVGLKDFRVVFVFQDPQAMHKFVNEGWEFGAEAEAGAKSGEKGGQVGQAGTFSSGMKIYQMTESGLVLRAALPLTKYRRYDELN